MMTFYIWGYIAVVSSLLYVFFKKVNNMNYSCPDCGREVFECTHCTNSLTFKAPEDTNKSEAQWIDGKPNAPGIWVVFDYYNYYSVYEATQDMKLEELPVCTRCDSGTVSEHDIVKSYGPIPEGKY